MRQVLAGIILLCCVAAVPAAARECTQFEAYTAESLYPYLSSWKEMHMAFRAYGHCDDGSIAEAFTEAISRLWEKQWDLVPEMLQETAADPGFRKFVFRRIGSEAIPAERRKTILDHARSRCPPDAGAVCQKVLAASGAD